MSIQWKCRFVHSNNSKGYHNLVQIILQIQSFFWWDGKQEESLLRFYSPHWDAYWCVCRISWGTYQHRLWSLSWWVVHIILVSWYHVLDSTCHQLFIMSAFQWWILLVRQYHSGSILILWWILLFWWLFRYLNLIHHQCNHFCEVFCDLLRFLIMISHVSFNRIFHDK